MTIECGVDDTQATLRRRTVQRDAAETRPGPGRGARSDPLCPIDRLRERRDLAATDRPSERPTDGRTDGRTPDVKFRRADKRTYIYASHSARIDAATHRGAACRQP